MTADEAADSRDTSMTPELPLELHQALADSPEGPLEVIDPISNKAYVLLSASQYQRVCELLGEGDLISEMSPLLADLSPEDWEDESNYESPQP